MCSRRPEDHIGFRPHWGFTFRALTCPRVLSGVLLEKDAEQRWREALVGRGKLYHVTPLTKSGLFLDLPPCLHPQPAALEQSGFPEDFTLLPYRGWIFPKIPGT